MKINPIPFNDWVEKCFSANPDPYYRNPQFKMFIPQVDWLKDKKGNIIVDQVLRFENLAEDWQVFSDKFGLPNKLDYLNKSGKVIGAVGSYFDAHSKKLIQEVFQEDFDHFSYNLKPKD